jgi:predicted transcriptional regulator
MADLHMQPLQPKTGYTAHGKLDQSEDRAEDKHPLERRDKLAIILVILEITKQPIKKTHLLYSAKINFYQLTRYLDLLLALGLLEEVSQPPGGYRITEKGRVLLELFAQV